MLSKEYLQNLLERLTELYAELGVIVNKKKTFLIAAMVHDYMCLNHSVVNSNRYLSTLIFNDLLEVGGTPAFKRWLMKHSVDNFQKFQKWKAGEVCSK